jgi:hypothetical protein
MPNFLVEETTVRDSGESSVLSLGESTDCHLLLHLCISHVMERQNFDVDVFASKDGNFWPPEPAVSFLQKFCCGTYAMILPNPGARFLKAMWRVSRWGRPADRPLCRFSISVEPARELPEMARRVMAGAA